MKIDREKGAENRTGRMRVFLTGQEGLTMLAKLLQERGVEVYFQGEHRISGIWRRGDVGEEVRSRAEEMKKVR